VRQTYNRNRDDVDNEARGRAVGLMVDRAGAAIPTIWEIPCGGYATVLSSSGWSAVKTKHVGVTVKPTDVK
jgi:hypothetical protein